MSNSKNSRTSPLTPGKKPYAAPTLSKFGNLTELTQGSKGSQNDSRGRRTRKRQISNSFS